MCIRDSYYRGIALGHLRHRPSSAHRLPSLGRSGQHPFPWEGRRPWAGRPTCSEVRHPSRALRIRLGCQGSYPSPVQASRIRSSCAQARAGASRELRKFCHHNLAARETSMTTAIGHARPFRESGNVHKWPASCWQNRSRGAAHQRFSGCRFSQRSISKLSKQKSEKPRCVRVRGYPRQPHASYPRECVRARARTRELQRFDPTCQSNPLTVDTSIRFSRSGVRHRRAA